MNFKVNAKYWLASAGVATLLGFASTRAIADTFPGSLTTYTKTAADLFTISGNTITVQGDTSSNSPTNQWSLGGDRLIGISKLYLVTPTNPVSPGPATVADVAGLSWGGYVATTSAAAATFTNQVGWLHSVDNGYYIYPDNSNGGGFNGSDPWIRVGNQTVVSKTGTNYTFGKFTFASPLLDIHNLMKYDIGVDYILANGNTGRHYFEYKPSSGGGSGASVPEPAYVQLGMFIVLGGAGTLLRRKSKISQS